MLRQLIILGVIAYASCVSIDECRFGESYWCKSLTTANKCGAVQHCMTTVWQNQKLTKDNADTCQYCVNIMKDVKTFIDNKQTQAEIKQFLISACKIVPDPSLSQTCGDVINQDFDTVMQMVEQELDPQTICATIGLCSGLEDKVQQPKKIPPVDPIILMQKATATDYCGDCKKFFADVKAILESPTSEKELETLIEDSLCSQLGGMESTLRDSSLCDQLVEEYVPTLVLLLSSEFDPTEVCQAMGFCNSTVDSKILLQKLVAKAQKAKSTAAPTDYCGDCKKFFADVVAILESPTSEKQLESLIEEGLCAQLGGYESTCDQLIEEYVPTLVMILSSEFDPAEVCQAMGFCNSTVDSRVLLKKLVTKAKSQLKAKKAAVSDGASTGCVICEFVMKEVDQLLSENSTQAEIMAALNKVCSIMPASIVGECDDFVNMYGPAVLMLLESELSPSEVCGLLGLCSNMKLKDTVALKDSEYCLLCETVIQYLDSLLSSQPTEKEIEDALDKVCNFLPANYRTECDTMVTQYTPMIIQLIKQEITPEQLCEAIGLCNSTAKAIGEPKIKPVKANLVGVNECTYGPAYWCATRENAKKCGAEPHCIKHVWN